MRNSRCVAQYRNLLQIGLKNTHSQVFKPLIFRIAGVKNIKAALQKINRNPGNC